MTKFVQIAAIAAALAATPGFAAQAPKPAGPKLEARIDASFSGIAVNTPLAQVRARLTEEKVLGCERFDDCDWIDGQHVRHFFGTRPGAGKLVIKKIKIAEFGPAPLTALGIGVARKRKEVLKAVSKFAPDLKLECIDPPATRTAFNPSCQAHLAPGLIAITFDRGDQLVEVRFEGYEGA